MYQHEGYLENADTGTRTRTPGHGHADMENADMGNADMENANMGNADMENADMENADMENVGMKNADKHIKISCIVDGLPCYRFGLPENFMFLFV